jgi:hypothetical protein
VKSDVLELIQEFYLPLGNQLAVCLPALIPSVLQMLDENDEKVKNLSLSIVDSLVEVLSSS